MKTCPLAMPFEGKSGCVRCGEAVPSRRHRWCGRACIGTYLRNHAWTDARREAVRLAGVDVDGDRLAQCDDCGALTAHPEVNHVEPREGAGYGNGCWNHQTNLQVLCHPCHVAETTRQIRERMPERPAVVARPKLPPMDSLWGAAS